MNEQKPISQISQNVWIKKADAKKERFGVSLINEFFKLTRHLSLMRDAMIIYRITRSSRERWTNNGFKRQM